MPSCSQLFLSLSVIVFVCGTLTNCGLSGNRDKKGGKEAKVEKTKANVESGDAGKKKEDLPPIRMAGEIASVHLAENFVLIKRYVQVKGFGSGALIASVSPEGKTCSLVLTGERIGRYYAADIRQGVPGKGDVVVQRELSKEAREPAVGFPEGSPGEKKAGWRR